MILSEMTIKIESNAMKQFQMNQKLWYKNFLVNTKKMVKNEKVKSERSSSEKKVIM